MPIIQFVMPSRNKQLKKLLHFYWEVCPKYDEKGKLKQEMILVVYVVSLFQVSRRCSDRICYSAMQFEMTWFVHSTRPFFLFCSNLISSNTPTNISGVQVCASCKKSRKIPNFWNPWYLPVVRALNIGTLTFAKMPSSLYIPSTVNSKISSLMRRSSCILSSSPRVILHANATPSSSLLIVPCLKLWSTSWASMIR